MRDDQRVDFGRARGGSRDDIVEEGTLGGGEFDIVYHLAKTVRMKLVEEIGDWPRLHLTLIECLDGGETRRRARGRAGLGCGGWHGKHLGHACGFVMADRTAHIGTMPRPNIDWIAPHPMGVHVPRGDFWIDPSRPVARAVITHGHADHARGGHGEVIATPGTLAIMEARYGPQAGARPLEYGETLRVGEVDVTLAPAGHVLGSAQAVMECAGERVVVSGDFKRAADPTCAAFTPVQCDVWVTEATFALPVFTHPPVAAELGKAVAAVEANPDRSVLIGAYALGKAQRVIAELRAIGWHAPIYIHGALQKLCEVYEAHGVALGDLRPALVAKAAEMRGQIVLAPPSALADRWSRRLPDPITAMASGWMRVRGRARMKGVELPLIVSDHADWGELTITCLEVGASEVWVTHGREEALVHWLEQRQVRARALHLVGKEDEDD